MAPRICRLAFGPAHHRGFLSPETRYDGVSYLDLAILSLLQFLDRRSEKYFVGFDYVARESCSFTALLVSINPGSVAYCVTSTGSRWLTTIYDLV